MRKRDMMDQNYALAQKIQGLEFENSGLRHQIKEAEEEIERLKNMIFSLGAASATTKPAAPMPKPIAPELAPVAPPMDTAPEVASIVAEPTPVIAHSAPVFTPAPVIEEPEYEDEEDEEEDDILLNLGENPIPNTPTSDVDYGASVIGKIVVNAANYSNRLTSGGETKYRELVNLILGRTEVAKADILSAVTSDNGFEAKKAAIDLVYEQACEYFESVMAQISDLGL